jgi:6-pyruvoyl-tetrahydropterin synthase
VGFVRDYNELQPFKAVVDAFDHRWLGYGRLAHITGEPRVVYVDPETEAHKEEYLATKPAFDFNPTAENMAKYFFNVAATMLPELSMIGVSETPKTWAWYAPQNLTLSVLDSAIETVPEPYRSRFKAALEEGG